MNKEKFKSVDVGNGININIVDGRDGKIAQINVSGQKKKLTSENVDSLINALLLTKQWLEEEK